MAAPWDKESLCQAIKEDPEFCAKCPTLAADILARRLQLVKLVEYLKDLLTDPEPSQRSKGILVLSSVLKEMPPDFLQEDEVRFIVVFFCDRLKDHHDVIPSALKGIFSILQMKNLALELPSQILTTLMLNITCQSQRQEDRLNIYRILDALVIPHLDSLKSLGPDLVYHIISAIDGERDPRNLKFLFSMLPAILRGLSLGHLTEDFFEVIACYFPVDFKPAAADPNRVTREELAFALAECLTAIPSFAEFCIPLLLEKLDSSLRLAKLDSLYLLRKGCQVFSPEDLSVHLSPLWMSLSRETLSNTDSEIREVARDAVTHILRCLADMPVVNSRQSDPLKRLLGDVVSASVSALNEVQTSLFLPATELLLAAAKSCSIVCESIFSKVLPVLLENFNGKQDPSDKSVYLLTISRLLAVCKILEVSPQNFPDLKVQWNLLVQLYLNAAKHDVSLVRKEALCGLTTLTPTLDPNERAQLCNVLCLAVDGENVHDVREQFKICLHEFGTLYSTELMNALAERLKLAGIQSDDSRFERRLEIQCHLAALKAFSQEILPSALDLAILSNNPHQIYTSLSSLRKLLEISPDNIHHVYECLHEQCNAVSRLLDWWISSVQNMASCEWVNSEAILVETCLVISMVTRYLNTQKQTVLVQHTVHKFHPGSDSFRPCDPSSPPPHLLTVALLEAVVGCLHCDVPVPEVHTLCCSLAKLAIGCSQSNSLVSACRLSASLINKIPEVRLLEEILADISTMLESTLAQNIEQDAAQAASLCGWIVKGLAMRGYGHLEYWIDKLVNILGDNRRTIALSAAQAFHVIMEDSATFLNQQSHCNLRLLYRQRVFVGALKLVKTSKTAQAGDRIAYLLALAHLLNGVPQSALANNLGEVLPLLLESLTQSSSVLLETALDTLLGLLAQSVFSDKLMEHIQSIVPRLLPLTTSEQSMQIRMSALRCLDELCNLPTELLLPFKDEVVSKTEICLDDSKRLVRKTAVKARTRWIMVGAPGSKP